ncbi:MULTISPECIES: hypothetical protein [unclassified Limnothrix]|uniref:hypothetical protein n=1 Tax=unclassified Limnothrix TaxID=2632864 RepID=UPI0013046BE2|nr:MULTISPECIES: hypothetical protein [unclassified Limnothrix]MBD2160975.1 hypothetical protein [Limnothrix sp. FACHB-1083]MBD2191676.1 hypothetical protein [Limnothrix sp. FACHB-1088]
MRNPGLGWLVRFDDGWFGDRLNRGDRAEEPSTLEEQPLKSSGRSGRLGPWLN